MTCIVFQGFALTLDTSTCTWVHVSWLKLLPHFALHGIQHRVKVYTGVTLSDPSCDVQMSSAVLTFALIWQHVFSDMTILVFELVPPQGARLVPMIIISSCDTAF